MPMKPCIFACLRGYTHTRLHGAHLSQYLLNPVQDFDTRIAC